VVAPKDAKMVATTVNLKVQHLVGLMALMMVDMLVSGLEKLWESQWVYWWACFAVERWEIEPVAHLAGKLVLTMAGVLVAELVAMTVD